MRRNVARFARYVERVADHLGDEVRWWITINEPTVYAKNGFVAGIWPPCRRNDWRAAWRAVRNMGRGAPAAYAILHRQRPDALVGFAHSAPLVVARAPALPVDRLAAGLRDLVLNRLPLRLMAGRRGRALDFIGLNYYARQVVYWRRRRAARCCSGATGSRTIRASRARSATSVGRSIRAGLKQVLERFARYGVPLLVTENGLATQDEELRLQFLRAICGSLAEALAAGVPVAGYCYWIADGQLRVVARHRRPLRPRRHRLRDPTPIAAAGRGLFRQGLHTQCVARRDRATAVSRAVRSRSHEPNAAALVRSETGHLAGLQA